MSFVSIVSNNEFLTIMSDGRVMEGDKIISEETKKFIVVDENYFVTFTGVYEHFFNFINNTGLNKGYEGELNDFAQSVYKQYIEKEYHKQNFTITFGGKNKQGNLEFYSFGNGDNSLSKSEPKTRDYQFCLSNATDHVYNMFLKLAQETAPRTPEEMLFVQQKLNEYVAAIDKTVNTNVFYHVIRRN